MKNTWIHAPQSVLQVPIVQELNSPPPLPPDPPTNNVHVDTDSNTSKKKSRRAKKKANQLIIDRIDSNLNFTDGSTECSSSASNNVTTMVPPVVMVTTVAEKHAEDQTKKSDGVPKAKSANAKSKSNKSTIPIIPGTLMSWSKQKKNWKYPMSRPSSSARAEDEENIDAMISQIILLDQKKAKKKTKKNKRRNTTVLLPPSAPLTIHDEKDDQYHHLQDEQPGQNEAETEELSLQQRLDEIPHVSGTGSGTPQDRTVATAYRKSKETLTLTPLSKPPGGRSGSAQDASIEEILAQLSLEEDRKAKKNKTKKPNGNAKNKKSSKSSSRSMIDQPPDVATISDTSNFSPYELHFRAKALERMKDKGCPEFGSTLAYVLALEANPEYHGRLATTALRMQSIVADALALGGHYDDALSLFRNHILKQEQDKMEDPSNVEDVIKTQRCIASILLNQLRWDEAVQLYKEIRDQLELVYGVDDDRTIDASLDVAQTLHKEGKLEEAVALYKEVYVKASQFCGPNDESTLVIGFNLGCALHAMDELSEAFDMFHNVFEKSRRHLGPTNILTIKSESRKAHIWLNKRKFKKAIELYQSAVSKRISAFGEGHQTTVAEKNNLVTAYIAAGRTKEAVQITLSLGGTGSGDTIDNIAENVSKTLYRGIEVHTPVRFKII